MDNEWRKMFIFYPVCCCNISNVFAWGSPESCGNTPTKAYTNNYSGEKEYYCSMCSSDYAFCSNIAIKHYTPGLEIIIFVCDKCYKEILGGKLKMDFFDKLSKSVTEVSQKTIAKTKELADTSKLNSMISEQERIIANQYFQIGKFYVSIHKDDFEDDFAGMIAIVADADAKIRDYKKQIQDIKGVQRCEKCGAEVPNGAAFCSSCGTIMPKVQALASDDYIKCENCGASVKKEMRFCTSCGNPMEAVLVKSMEIEHQTTSSQEKVCPNCGEKNEADVAFCTECGTKF